MDWGWLCLNMAYFVYAASGGFKDMLRLRLTLLVATGFFLTYGLVASIWSVFWWNLPVGAVHSYQAWLLIKQRRNVDLNDEAEAIRTLLYPELDRVSFHLFWSLGRERVASDETLIVKGTAVDDLTLVLEGDVDVLVRDDLTVRLGPLRIVGEMSSVTGNAASATVITLGDVRIRQWNKVHVERLLDEHPKIERAHLRAIGSELSRKLS